MLVIRRKPGESILIGEDIEIQVIDISPSRVRIGISAPSSVLILRKEIQLAQRQNLAAALRFSPDAVRSVLSRFPAR
ncbi:MAG: carbon storage regulator [Bryobacteraceae bacterium]|nr:carbon storage regulator [Bryobacteraceae bacterium]